MVHFYFSRFWKRGLGGGLVVGGVLGLGLVGREGKVIGEGEEVVEVVGEGDVVVGEKEGVIVAGEVKEPILATRGRRFLAFMIDSILGSFLCLIFHFFFF